MHEAYSEDGSFVPDVSKLLGPACTFVHIRHCLEQLTAPHWQNLLHQISATALANAALVIDFIDLHKVAECWCSMDEATLLDILYGNSETRHKIRKNAFTQRDISGVLTPLGWNVIGVQPGRDFAPLSTSVSFEKKSHLQPMHAVPAKLPRREPWGRAAERILRGVLRVAIGTLSRAFVRSGKYVNLGCGRYPLPGFTNVDSRRMPWINEVGNLFQYLSSRNDSSIVEIHLSHVFEHLLPHDARSFLRLAHAKLLPRGRLRLAIPDLESAVGLYSEAGDTAYPSEVLRSVLFGGQTYFDNYHFRAYSFEMLKRELNSAGFGTVQRVDRFSHWPFWDSAELTQFSGRPGSLNVVTSKQ
jgi:predicted SAM-dependent methyltransferase